MNPVSGTLQPQGQQSRTLAPCSCGDSSSGKHFVQFYEKDEVLVSSLGGFARDGFETGAAVVVLATPAHRQALADWLREQGVGLDRARASGAYIELDAAEVLDRVMDGDRPDPVRFAKIIEPVIERASAGGRQVRAFGELVALLTERGNSSAAVGLEALWNELGRRRAFSLFCAYPMRCFAGAVGEDALRQVCAAHDRVIPAESYPEEASENERAMAVAVLQQKTASLDAEETLRQSAEESLRSKEEVMAALETFAYSISHDLRAPLRTIRSFVQVLTEDHSEEVSPEAADYLRRIAAASENMHHLIQEVLGNSLLAASEIRLERVDISCLVKSMIEHCPAFQPPQAKITFEHPLPVVYGNSSSLTQIFSNLLANAVKFVPPETRPEVHISTEELEAFGNAEPAFGRVRICVRDNGIGLPADEDADIFGLFRRARTDYEGTGIGLATVKQAVEQIGGRVGCRSNPEGGSTFWMELKVFRT